MGNPPMSSLPPSQLRTASVYRSWGQPAQRIGVGFWTAPPGYVGEYAVGDYWAIMLVLRGAAVHNGRALTPGDAFTRHPGAEDRFVPDDAYAECWLDLGGELAEVAVRLGLSAPDDGVLRPGIDLALVRRWHRLLGRVRAADDAALPVLASEIVGIVGELVAATRPRIDDPYAALVAEMARLLEGGAKRAELERLAAGHRLSFERLRKLFKQRTGLAPGAYRQRQRMDRARELLRDGDLSVAEVAKAVGCASAATFSAQFKADAGDPPDRWRRGQIR